MYLNNIFLKVVKYVNRSLTVTYDVFKFTLQNRAKCIKSGLTVTYDVFKYNKYAIEHNLTYAFNSNI